MTDQEKQFLIELRALTIKHGLAIGGCGCCGSPFLSAINLEERTDAGFYAAEDDADHIAWFGSESKLTAHNEHVSGHRKKIAVK